MLLAVTQGVAFLLTHITDFTFTQGLLISWFSYTAFTMYSGTRGVILTDTLMFLLFTSVAKLALIFLAHDSQVLWLNSGRVAIDRTHTDVKEIRILLGVNQYIGPA